MTERKRLEFAMELSRLVTATPKARVFGDANVEILEIAYDSRAVRPGSMFVAVPSVGGDSTSGGYRFLHEAIRRGAAAIAVEHETELSDVPVVQVPDARSALADLSAEFFGHPSRELALFGVTGTDGKTTTCYLLDGIFTSLSRVTGLIGTVEIKIGQGRELNSDRMTTPEALDLQRLLRTMVDSGVTHVAMEVSSHALALRRVRNCSFAACAFTNITGDHVEFHGSWEAYFEAKSRLFTEVAPGSPAILNRDDEQYARLTALVPGPTTSYSMRTRADVEARAVQLGPEYTRFDLVSEGTSAPVRLRLPGAFNVSNALAAAGLARAHGVSIQAIADGLSSAEAPPGRMQRITEGAPFQVVVDYAHTLNAFRSVLKSLRSTTPPPRRLIAVFGAAGNRDRSKRPLLARIAREYTDFFIITNEDPFGEKPNEIIDEVASGVPVEEHGSRFVREPERGRAIELALQRAGPGDTIAILGKGHERSIVEHGRKVPWSDAAAVREALGIVR